jgi:hypothetical protein
MHATNLGETTVRRRLFQWPEEAVSLVAVHRNAGSSQLRDLIAQLVQISGNPRTACWRFVRSQGIRVKLKPSFRRWTESEERRLLELAKQHSVAEMADVLHRSKVAVWNRLEQLGVSRSVDVPRLQWTKKAKELVRANRTSTGAKLSDLVAALVLESGNPRRACWRFVRRLGVRGTITSRLWTDAERRRLLHLIERQPVAEVAKTLRRSERAVRIKLGELGANSHIGKDWFMPGTLASALHVSREKVQRWIDRGWLKATEQSAGKVKRVLIAADDFCRFCRQYRREVVGRRLNVARLDFIQSFVFPPSHAELLPVRASKLERAAYRAQMERQEGDEDGGDELERAPDGVDPSTHAFPPRSEEPGTDPVRGEVCA